MNPLARIRHYLKVYAEPCVDCGHSILWSESAGDYLHITAGVGCYMHPDSWGVQS